MYQNEKEILFQPFSFFILDDVKIDKNIQQIYIYMIAVGKCEILENEVKNSSNIVEIVYNSVLNIKKTKI